MIDIVERLQFEQVNTVGFSDAVESIPRLDDMCAASRYSWSGGKSLSKGSLVAARNK